MVEVFRIDEYLERPAFFVLRALIQYDVIDGHVRRVIGDWRFDLVGRTDQNFRPFKFLVHANDFGTIPTAAFTLEFRPRCPVLGFWPPYVVTDNFLVYLDHVCAQNFP